MSDNNEVTHPFDVTNTETGKTYQLSPNSSKSVQPIALLRLSVFLPRWELKRSDTEILRLTLLMSCRAWSWPVQKDTMTFGSLVLSFRCQPIFKCWLGCIMAFSKYGFASDKNHIVIQ
nr:hypothetical protein [Escherichia coli]